MARYILALLGFKPKPIIKHVHAPMYITRKTLRERYPYHH